MTIVSVEADVSRWPTRRISTTLVLLSGRSWEIGTQPEASSREKGGDRRHEGEQANHPRALGLHAYEQVKDVSNSLHKIAHSIAVLSPLAPSVPP